MAQPETAPTEVTKFVDLSINAKEVAESKVQFLRERFRDSGSRKFVLGLSGGVDSAVSCALAVQAVGAENVVVVKMPYGELGQGAADDADLVIEKFGILPQNVYSLDIQPAVDAFLQTMADNLGEHDSQIGKGNAMARVRMMMLYHLAYTLKGQVLGTENKSEHWGGYFTRGGDETTDNEPIHNLYKVQVWQLAQHLGVPEKIVNKKATADLWIGQTDEDELGYSYALGDQILYCHIDLGEKMEEIIKRGFDPDAVAKVLQRVKSTDFKRQVPYKPQED